MTRTGISEERDAEKGNNRRRWQNEKRVKKRVKGSEPFTAGVSR